MARRPVGPAAREPAGGMIPRCSDAYRSTSSSRVSTGWTRTPGTSRASAALASGTTTCRTLRRAAARTRGRTPGTDRTEPSRPSSPMWTTSRTTSGGMDSLATSAATQMARSKPEPTFGIDAGDRFTVTRRSGRGHRVRRRGLDPVRRLGARAVGTRRRRGTWATRRRCRPRRRRRTRRCRAGRRRACRPRVTRRPRRRARSGTVRVEGAGRRRRRRGSRRRPGPVSRRRAALPARPPPTAATGQLAVVDRLDRLPEGRAAPGLDLADDETAAVTRDDVDLAEVAPPVLVEDVEASVRQVAHCHPLAVAAEPACGVPRHPRGDGSRTVHRPTVPVGMRDRTTLPTGCGRWYGTVAPCGRPDVPPR